MPFFTPHFDRQADFDLAAMLPDRFQRAYPDEDYRVISQRDGFTLVGPKTTGQEQSYRYFILYRLDIVAILSLSAFSQPYPSVTISFIKPQYRSLGFGFELYQAAINDFGGLVSDRELTDSSRRIWDKLSRLPQYHVNMYGSHEEYQPDNSNYETRFQVEKKPIVEDRYQDGKKFYRELSPHRDENIFRNPEWQPEITQWPPNNLRDIERQIFQRPDWLHFYARFDWTSWTVLEGRHWYNRHTDEFHFYDVPAISHYHNVTAPDRTLVVITSGGEIKSQSYDIVVLPTALRMCMDVVDRARPKLKYLRGRYYIRFGMWPKNERSQNFLIRDRVVLEAGVSAYHADYDLDEDRWAIDPSVHEETVSGTMQTLIYGNRPIFLVQGTEIDEEGADGEPLLHNVKLIERLERDSVYVPGIFDPREDD